MSGRDSFITKAKDWEKDDEVELDSPTRLGERNCAVPWTITYLSPLGNRLLQRHTHSLSAQGRKGWWPADTLTPVTRRRRLWKSRRSDTSYLWLVTHQKSQPKGGVWWGTPLVSALGIQRQAALSELRVGLDLHIESQVSQGYLARVWLRK